MRCKKVKELLEDHVDGLLAAPQAEPVRDHLDRCDDCRATSLALKAASASLATWDDVEPPAACFDRILARIDALPPEALVRPEPPSLLDRLPRFESLRMARVRTVLTGGLAAAAAILAGVLLSDAQQRPVRRSRSPFAPVTIDARAGSFFQGYDWDNDLLYQGARSRPVQPAMRGLMEAQRR